MFHIFHFIFYMLCANLIFIIPLMSLLLYVQVNGSMARTTVSAHWLSLQAAKSHHKSEDSKTISLSDNMLRISDCTSCTVLVNNVNFILFTKCKHTHWVNILNCVRVEKFSGDKIRTQQNVCLTQMRLPILIIKTSHLMHSK